MKNLLATSAIVAAMTVGSTAQAQGFGGGAYINIFGGYDLTTTNTAVNDGADSFDLEWAGAGGFIFGAAIGTEISRGLRAEAEVSYSIQDVDTLTAILGTGIGSTSGDSLILSNTYLLGNVWYDVPLGAGSGFTPYVGGGLGAAIVNIDVEDVDSDADGIDPATGFAYQIGAGVQIPVGAGLFDISYRFRGVAAIEFDFDPVGSGISDTASLEGDSFSNSLQAGYVLKF